MSKLPLKMKEYRAKYKMSQTQLARKLGVTRGAIANYEVFASRPSWETLDKMAKIFNTTVDNLIGRTDEPIKNPNRIRVLGSIPAGIPVEMVEDIGEFEDIPESWLSGGKEYFALKVKGNSMNPKYVENDIVIVLKENTCENGDDCIVVVNGFDATLKRVFIKENGLLLQPLNADYQATFYTCEEVRGEPGVKILGVIKEIRRKA